MEITVVRKWPRDKYIIGQLFIDGQLFCHTMEPPYSASHPCIPKGTYKVEMYPSAKFKGMRPIIKDVPKRSGILIHEGNVPANTMGCILVGRNTKVGMLTNSKATLNDLISKISKSSSTTIIIKECFS